MNRDDLEAATRASVAGGQGDPGRALRRLKRLVEAAQGGTEHRSHAS